MAIVASSAQNLTTLHSFNGTDGAHPDLGFLVQGSDGNLYGTTDGSDSNAGTVFTVSVAGTLKTLYSFTGGDDGGSPYAGLVQATDGNFYGTTYSGGAYSDPNYCPDGCGTVFQITPTGALTTLYNFCAQSGCPDGRNPVAGLAQAVDGNLYGTAAFGGANNAFGGTVFKISLTGTLTTLHSFDGTDGAYLYGGLVQASDGNFYGTTNQGGANHNCNGGCGTVFKITPAGMLTTLYSFCPQGGCADGNYPYSSLVQGRDGNLYGTTQYGGSEIDCGFGGCGTVFKITLSGQLTTLYRFCTENGCMDGEIATAGLVQGTDGNFYGTTQRGGSGSSGGTVFKITPSGTLATLYSFCSLNDCEDGDFPEAGLVQGTDGNFYGTTFFGGANQDGTVFQLSVPASYALTVSVTGNGTVTSADGHINCPGVCSYLYPANAQVTLNATPDANWDFGGWSGACHGSGCFVTMTQDLSVAATFTQTYILTVLNDGGGSVTSTDSNINCPGVCGYSYPVNAVVTLNATPAPGEHFTGWLGVCDGFDSCEVTMAQNQSVRATFGQNSDHYTLIVSVSGSGTVTSADHFINCPGTCRFTYPVDTQVTLNASPGKGSVFTGWSGDCTGNGSCTVTMSQFRSVSATFSGPSDTVVHTFDSANKGGQNPTGSITSDPLGNSYSTTSVGGAFGQGTVFELSPDGTETVLYSFCAADGCTDGAVPLAGLVQGTDGNFYGTSSAGGSSNNAGTVFSINPFGTLTTLHTFCAQSGCMDGSTPYARLVQGTDGNFYGTTSAGGLYAAGTVFQITPSGFTTLHNFCTLDECADGATPYAGLVQGADGNFYGTTHDGGAHSSGTVFQITPTGTLTTLYNFCGQDACADGQNPFAEVIFDNAGNLYGTTAYGGTYGGGTAFELSPNGGGGWTEMVLHSFGDASDGKNPQGGLVFDGYGNLYGTTMNGGLYASGMVFELPNSIKNSANLRCCRGMPLYNFGSTPRDGQNPSATLIWGTSGKLLGTTVKGGDNEAGTVFGVSPPGLANYDPNFAAPVCNQPFQFCDSGPAMLSGHGNMAGGAEPNQPNTIRNSCADGTAGTFHVDESIDELTVETIRGVMLHSGEFVRVTAKVWVSDSSVDKLDLYYTRSANNPQWLYIATLTPNGTGAQTLSAVFRLAPGAWQAVRANLRKGGNRSSCSTGDYDDHDDLVFVVR